MAANQKITREGFTFEKENATFYYAELNPFKVYIDQLRPNRWNMILYYGTERFRKITTTVEQAMAEANDLALTLLFETTQKLVLESNDDNEEI